MSTNKPTTGASNDDIELGKINGGGDDAQVEVPPEPKTGQGFLKPVPETTPIERAAMGAAGVAVITALLAMIIEGGAIVLIAGILSILMGPYAYYQQVWLTDIKALKETQGKLQELVDGLTVQQDRLKASNDEFEGELERLADVGDALEAITETQGLTVSDLEAQVQFARENLSKMHQNLQGTIVNNVMDVVWGSDTDMDYKINEEEYDELVRRIGKTPGVEINGDKLRDMIVGKEMRVIQDVLQNLMSDDLPDEERIFKIVHT